MSAPAPAPCPRTPARVTLLAALLGATAIILAPAAAASADGAGSVGSVTVEPTTGLPEEGAEVVVRGTGFDPSAGVYVAVCVDNGPGQKPTPCIGGADTAGVGGAVWISDTPPSYAEGLTQPYGPDGSFEVTLPVPVTDEVTGVDCRVVTCAVTVRFDHLRQDDRRADHVVPVSFGDATVDATDEAEETAAEQAEPTPEATATADAPVDDGAAEDADEGTRTGLAVAIGALALAAVAVGVWLVRRRRSDDGDPQTPGSTPEPPA